MIKRIRPGHHRAIPPSFGIYWNKKIFQHHITFDKSCRYITDAENDINKLYGVGYVNGGHHVDSIRFGWRYSPSNDKIEILSYVYISKERKYEHICYVDFDVENVYSIFVRSTEYFLVCGLDYVTVQHRHRKRLQYALGFWFGGSNPASHTMSIEIK